MAEQASIEKIAILIVDQIVNDLCDRKGLADEWDQIDKSIQKEIRKTWESIVEKTLWEESHG